MFEISNNFTSLSLYNMLEDGTGLRDSTGDVQCRDFHKLGNITDICSFVNQTASCAIDEGFITYTSFIYCYFSEQLVPLAVFILFLWWLLLFIGLAVTADDFFCPALTVISKTLGLSHNVAGVTFLAFGNGAPDIFSAIAAIGNAKNGDAGLAMGALLGAGVFVTTVVAGVIAIICPFDAMQRPFLRDVIFYLAAVFWTFYILWKKEITKYESIGFIGLYIVYVLVVVVGRYVYQKRRGQPAPPVTVVTQNTITAIQTRQLIIADPDDDTADSISVDPNLSSVNTILEDETRPLLNTDKKLPAYVDSTVSVEYQQYSPISHFFSAINPIDSAAWHKSSWFGKIYHIFKSPVLFVLKLTIPVVDYEVENHNWCRYLNALHCTTGPMFSILSTNLGLKLIFNIYPVWAIILPIGLLLSLSVLLSSKNQHQPIYHPLFAYLGFLVAVIWIYCIANEVVNILQTFGIVFNISNAILGLTFLAWGNSVGDLVADTAMARQGYPRMGISACFGGPLFNLLLGIGIPFTIGTIKQGGSYKINLTLEEYVLAGFLGFSLVSSLLIVTLSKFRMSRGWGVYLMILYVVFLVVAILAETGVLKADV